MKTTNAFTFARLITAVSLFPLALIACGGSSDGGRLVNVVTPSTLEQRMESILFDVDTDTDFTLLTESANGKRFEFSRGDSSSRTVYKSASSSKMVTAAVILQLVKDGVMTLDDHPQQYIGFWPTTGNLADIQLRHLLSFTSGLNDAPACLNFPRRGFESCIENIPDDNASAPTPGTRFHYNGAHLQVAGLMAIHASDYHSWAELFDYFKQQTGLFPSAVYDLPSEKNPRLGGGMHWNAVEYLAFLSALYHQTILTPALIDSMTSDQLNGATIEYSPAEDSPLGVAWHYGYGLWIECTGAHSDCATTTRASSAGAYGAYPFIDFKQGYFGIVAREGRLTTGHKGYQVWASVESELAQWAAENR